MKQTIPTSSVTLRVRLTLVARPQLTPDAQELCKCEHNVFRSRIYILERYFASKSIAALREAFSNMCPEKNSPNKTEILRLVTKFMVYACLREECGHI
jgi:hypothetical protein